MAVGALNSVFFLPNFRMTLKIRLAAETWIVELQSLKLKSIEINWSLEGERTTKVVGEKFEQRLMALIIRL